MGFRRVETVCEHFRHGIPLAILCRACGRYIELNPADLPRHCPSRSRPENLPFRCSRCGARGETLAHGKEARRLHYSRPSEQRGQPW